MVTLPAPYVATKYPGYFWNVETQRLYSLKVTGVLREMKFCKPNWLNKWDNFSKGQHGGYRVSHKGARRNLYLSDLKKLTIADSVIPEEK